MKLLSVCMVAVFAQKLEDDYYYDGADPRERPFRKQHLPPGNVGVGHWLEVQDHTDVERHPDGHQHEQEHWSEAEWNIVWDKKRLLGPW